MAASQSSRKQVHLEAGKRKLEEFRKKKAKKVVAGSQSQSGGFDYRDMVLLESEKENIRGLDNVKDLALPMRNSSFDGRTALLVHECSYGNNRLESGRYGSHGDERSGVVVKNAKDDTQRVLDTRLELTPDQAENNRLSDLYPIHDRQLEEVASSSLRLDHGSFAQPISSLSERYISTVTHYDLLAENKAASAPYEDITRLMSNSIGAATTADDYHGAEMISEFNRGWSSDVRNEMCCGNGDSQLSLKCAPWRSSGSLFVGSGVHVRSSLTQSSSLASEIEARQAHPSFLDPNNVPSASSSFDLYCQHEMAEKSYALERFRVNYGNCSSLASRSVDNIIVEILPDALAKEESHVNMLSTTKEQTIPLMHEIHASNGDEDFDALEEHIDDLTRQKFSLQRALEASCALAESLTVENSSLTDSFNQQGTVMCQLKSDMEKLQEEIKNQLAALEAMKVEYANARLECSAADERTKMLISEVIGLEEKALRFRSKELKLEREMENASAEVSSHMQKVSRLEKERSELLATIDALKEERSILQSKLRKASFGRVVTDKSKPITFTKNVSTSTEDLDVEVSNLEFGISNLSISPISEVGSSIQSRDVSGDIFLLESFGSCPVNASTSIPLDQLRTIINIDSLLSEIALEKVELLRALAIKSSKCSESKALNKISSQKLEVQTQRLEILTAQSMSNENIEEKSAVVNNKRTNPPFLDEGEEVVERMLEWIIQLFPGEPFKRQTSKLL